MDKVAIVTPYYQEELSTIAINHNSVLNQVYPCTHVLVADGKPYTCIDLWKADHIILPKNHNDIGSTPRLIGCYHAIGLNFDAVAFLDADNWYDPKHINRMMTIRKEQGAAVVSSGRMLCRLDGSIMAQCKQTDPHKFIDTNCMLIGKEAFHILHHWVLMPSYGHVIGDRIFWSYIRASGIKTVHSHAPTVFYRCQHEGIYTYLDEPLPKGVKSVPDYQQGFKMWIEDGHPPLS